MKYIRTPENTIEIVVREENVFSNELNLWMPSYLVAKHRESNNFDYLQVYFKGDCKVGDTIEELCDEFVIKDKFTAHIIKPQELDRDCEGWTKRIGIPEGIVECYGAIWTDKGLIYVAKMNDKGELELL